TALRRTSSNPAEFEIEMVPQTTVANKVRHLDEGFIGRDGHSVTPAFHEYLTPLLGENPFPIYERFDAPVHVEGASIESVRAASGMDDENLEIGVDVSDGVDGTAVDSRGKVFVIRIGQDVIADCGHKLGEVVDVRDDYVVVEKGFFNPEDIYVPKDQIASFDEYHL